MLHVLFQVRTKSNHAFSKALAANYISCGCVDVHFQDQALGTPNLGSSLP